MLKSLINLRTPLIQRLSFSTTARLTKDIAAKEVKDEPIKFFGSKAASWKAKDTRSGKAEEMLWFQPYVVSGSLAVFLIYFCFLREENDIDRKLEGTLFEHIAGLEEVQLTMTYKHNLENNIDNSSIEKRLKELGVDPKLL
ncbi:hypothetical protein ACFFRR_008771 [Megaselia abdita]